MARLGSDTNSVCIVGTPLPRRTPKLLLTQGSGDSYTTTGFKAWLDPQPSLSNVLGVLDYPGLTTSNGPNWLEYLTMKYNSSLVETYNIACGGATIDAALARPYLSLVPSLEQQVHDEFIPHYSGHSSSVLWDSASTLFVFWFGINDIGNTYQLMGVDDYEMLYPKMMNQYAIQVQAVYDTGARNFLFLNVPPIQRSPQTTSQGSDFSAREAAAISIFNAGLNELIYLTSTHEGATVFSFNAYDLFSAVLDDPTIFSMTSGYTNTTDFCPAYSDGTATMNTFIATCNLPVNEYFWLNALHPTNPMHNLLASQISELLG